MAQQLVHLSLLTKRLHLPVALLAFFALMKFPLLPGLNLLYRSSAGDVVKLSNFPALVVS
ncbi:MAG: hypothetical protein ACU4EQ_01650 [Candidatus Nitrosoglobus sp.]|jgi:hypothetical protein